MGWLGLVIAVGDPGAPYPAAPVGAPIPPVRPLSRPAIPPVRPLVLPPRPPAPALLKKPKGEDERTKKAIESVRAEAEARIASTREQIKKIRGEREQVAVAPAPPPPPPRRSRAPWLLVGVGIALGAVLLLRSQA